MRCHIVPSGVLITPFLDPIGETLIANRTLRAWQEEAMGRSGLVLAEEGLPPEGPCVVLQDNLFLSAPLLRAFVAASRRAPPNAPAALELSDSAMVAEYHHLQGIAPHPDREGTARARYPLFYLPPGVRFEDARETPTGQWATLPIKPRERVFEFDVPEHYFGKQKLRYPLTAMSAMVLRHWVHILRANLMAQAVDALDQPRWRRTLRTLWALLTALPPSRARLMRRMSRIGRDCRIHPTAIIEASTIEDGVTIGPHAVVSFSRIGARSWIQELAKVSLSVLGEKSFVSSGTMLNSSVLYPQAAASQRLMQMSVLGRRSITTGGAFLMDMRFDDDVRVPLDGRLQSLGTRFLGSAIGHEARLGTGFWIAPGREIPNGVPVVRDPAHVVRRVPRDAAPGTVLVVRGERLVPLTDDPTG